MEGDANEIKFEIFGKLLRFSTLIPSKPNKISLLRLKLPTHPSAETLGSALVQLNRDISR